MLNQINVSPTIGVQNLAVAKKFYEEKLGLTPTGPDDDQVQLYQSGDAQIEIYKSEFAGSNKATAMTWGLGDKFENEIEELKNKGVIFEHYEMPDLNLNGDIHESADQSFKVAWFKDPDGNILCLHNH